MLANFVFFFSLFFCVHGSLQQCLCQVSGNIGDCNCDVESIDNYNNLVFHPQLQEIVKSTYFRHFRINMQRKCHFWPNDGTCVLKDCAVSECSPDELPAGFDSSTKRKSQEMLCNEPDQEADELGKLDATVGKGKEKEFDRWEKFDASQDKFCLLDDASDPNTIYVDLLRNPEKYTGYKGRSAHRVWSAIYNENCFHSEPLKKTSYESLMTNKLTKDLCLEKRVFYRLVSGLHSSISTHICTFHPLNPLQHGPNKFGRHLTEFQRRFDSEEGVERLKNLYFVYLIELRAIHKLADFLKDFHYYTGNKAEDASLSSQMKIFSDSVKKFPHHFDETILFRDKEVAYLKDSYKHQFRNISRIMDCVGCDKCKLWGKLQTQGLGTALGVLFSESKEFNISRQEIVALINAFSRLSESIWQIDQFREISNSHKFEL